MTRGTDGPKALLLARPYGLVPFWDRLRAIRVTYWNWFAEVSAFLRGRNHFNEVMASSGDRLILIWTLLKGPNFVSANTLLN